MKEPITKGWRGEHPRHRCSEESEDKTAEHSACHDAGMSLAGIKFRRMQEIERPERHSDDSGQQPGRKKDSKRLASHLSKTNTREIFRHGSTADYLVSR
jgi:hypothetical protein